ncbi:hypothetical protein [Bdellovibrio reynosensis]|uniref:Uncharacterized protein n=1 Tax=Bdellovibrio reynosensis TaxID=2835041 RepID=A0ABY4CE07_9BACT|nr:hypothetical protein [Bdellovibrio reynosensis]UOF01976.1 hypothetical protein MNR06_03285 [Bdellovibrio reynosensis]
MKKLLLLSIIIAGALGCAENGNETPTKDDSNKSDSIVDEASLQERDLINEQMNLIKQYAADFAIPEDLNRIPIVVVKNAEVIKRASSGCLYAGSKGLKIVLSKNFFTQRVYEKDTGFASPLFNLLIHEIGHCYKNRQHEFGVLRKKGYKAQFKIQAGNQTRLVSYYSVQATMMHNTYFQMPKNLEKYYVGEIFGKWRAQSLEELQGHYDFEIVPEEVAASDESGDVEETPFPHDHDHILN